MNSWRIKDTEQETLILALFSFKVRQHLSQTASEKTNLCWLSGSGTPQYLQFT